MTVTEWAITSITPAPEGRTCGYSESGCPCCTCEESATVSILWTRERYSRSRKAMVPQTTSEGRCAAHASMETEGPSC